MSRPRIVIVGAGFAGYRTARTLSRLTRGRADIILLNPTDYFLYLPLLPQVAAGILEPRRVTVSLAGTLPPRAAGARARPTEHRPRRAHRALHRPRGRRRHADLRPAGARRRQRQQAAAHPGRRRARARLPRPARGAVPARPRDPPGGAGRRRRTTPRAAPPGAPSSWSAPATPAPRSPRRASCSPTRWCAKQPLRDGHAAALAAARHRRRGCCPSWTRRLSRTADRVLRQRGVDVRMGTSVKEATSDGVLLTDGEFVDTRTLVWCVGRTARPARRVARAARWNAAGCSSTRTLQVPGPPRGVRLRRRGRRARPDAARASTPR